MDLVAFGQISNFENIAKDNGIEIPRLRGYRLMKDEKPVSQDEIKIMEKASAINSVINLCEAEPFWSSNPFCYTWTKKIEKKKHYYLITSKDDNGDECYSDIRWDRIHGKKRKILKFAIKKKKRAIQAQYDVWNKYTGKENVLYIHSRMGGNNWKYYAYQDSIINQPWFLERVDDWFDETYCDFYAKIK